VKKGWGKFRVASALRLEALVECVQLLEATDVRLTTVGPNSCMYAAKCKHFDGRTSSTAPEYVLTFKTLYDDSGKPTGSEVVSVVKLDPW